MESKIQSLRLWTAWLLSFVCVSALLLLWSATAYAQSRADQYGSPTDPVNSASQATQSLSVLPDTGGPMILLVGGALIVAGTGLSLLRYTGRR